VRDLPNVTIHQLLYVREAARAATWTEAAQRLGVSQPALSQGIAEVERRLGVRLFDRRARVRVPTPELRDVLAVAERIIAGIDDLDHRLHEFRTGSRGTVRVGMIDTAALGVFAETVSRFRSAHPKIDVTLIVEPSVPLSARVASGELDLAIVVAPNAVLAASSSSFIVTPLFDEKIYVYPAVTTSRRTNTAAALAGPWVTYPAGSQSRELIVAALARQSVTMRVVAESSNPDVLRQMVRLGVGSCALPRDVAESGDDPLKRISGGPLALRSIAVVRRSEALPNDSAELFTEALMTAH
jgi:DNA-binding transcriptional LysR family regulator